MAPPSGGRDPFDFSLSRKLQKPADNNSSGYGSLANFKDSQVDFSSNCNSEFTSVRGVSHSVTNRARNGAPSGLLTTGAAGVGGAQGPNQRFMSLEEECNWILSGREPIMQDGDDYSDDGDEDNTLDDISGDEVTDRHDYAIFTLQCGIFLKKRIDYTYYYDFFKIEIL